MTDQTTARDRAVEQAYGIALSEIADAAISTTDNVIARRVVLALQAHPEVLRALAGAPTADVAADRHEVAHFVPGLDGPIWTPQLGCATCADLMAREMVPAAPEGVDAADELDTTDTEEI